MTKLLAKPKYHWTRDKVDKRDHIYQPLTVKTKLPTAIDLRSWDSPIEDQGYLGSCTGNAIAGAIELINRKNSKKHNVSRLFIYYQERLLEGSISYDAGAYIRDGMKACNRWGAPIEELWPYYEYQFATRPSAAAYNDAITRRVTGYQRCLNFNAVKVAIAAGNPVVVGFDVYESFESMLVERTGLMPYPDKRKEYYLGGHAVCLVGYNDNQSRFIARNSWGTSWGDRGYFYMPYKVIQDTTMSDDFWLINAVQNP